MNRIYASDAMECVAVANEPGNGPEYFVVPKRIPRDSTYWRCVWG